MQRPKYFAFAWRFALFIIAMATLTRASTYDVRFKVTAPPDSAAQDDSILYKDFKTTRAVADYSAIAAHPLFEPSRQPWSKPQAASNTTKSLDPVPQPPKGYTLVGLVLSAGERAALLRNASGQTRVLREGNMLDGWLVQRIAWTGISLYLNRYSAQITMRKQAY